MVQLETTGWWPSGRDGKGHTESSVDIIVRDGQLFDEKKVMI